MLDIEVQPSRPYIQFAGVKEFCPPLVAQMAEVILGARGEIVPVDRFVAKLGTTREVVWTEMYQLRKIFERHEYLIATVGKTGVRLTKQVAPEYIVKSPKKF